MKVEIKEKMNVGFIGTQLLSWGGGAEFLSYCMNSLFEFGKPWAVRLFLLIDRKIRMDSSEDSIKKLYPDVTFIFYDGNEQLNRHINEHNLNILVLTQESLGQWVDIPWIGYIPDFQHRYLPQFFDRNEIVRRDLQFSRMYDEAPVIIVNSQAAKSDIDRFYNREGAAVISLPFAPIPEPEWLVDTEENFKELRDCYQLPSRYFVISNQFWIHKSHMTAFKAFKMLLDQTESRDLGLVCTGKTEDYRQPQYFDHLLKELKELNLLNHVRILGYIPKNDQIQIMRRAIANIQPTLFEGGPGGGSVYNAVALGVVSIISDIPINREIKEDTVIFFKKGSAEDLAQKMLDQLRVGKSNPAAGKDQLEQRGRARKMELGKALWKAIHTAGERFKERPVNSFTSKERIRVFYPWNRNLEERSKTYQSLINQTYPNYTIDHSDFSKLDLSKIDEEFVYILQEGYELHPRFFEILLKHKRTDVDVIGCSLKVLIHNNEQFFEEIIPIFRLNENTVVHFVNKSCLLFSRSFFIRHLEQLSDPDIYKNVGISVYYDALVSVPLEQYIEEKLPPSDHAKVFIYGAGGHTRILLENCSFNNVNLMGIFDKNKDLIGQKLLNCTIFDSRNIKNHEVDAIIISSKTYENEIFEELSEFVEPNKLVKLHYNIS